MQKDVCKTGDVFNVDSEVLCDGWYVCAPCGNKQYFKQGQVFPRCFQCIDDEGNPEKLRKGLGLWELLTTRANLGNPLASPGAKQK